MSWLRIDDTFTDHPKVLRAGEDAPLIIALQIRAISYASRQLTNGFIADYVLDLISRDLDCARNCAKCGGNVAHRPSFWAEMMVRLGLWEPVEGGYQIHDYLVYNRSRRQALKDQKQREIASKRGGDATRKKWKADPQADPAGRQPSRPASRHQAGAGGLSASSRPLPSQDQDQTHPPTPQGGSLKPLRRSRRKEDPAGFDPSPRRDPGPLDEEARERALTDYAKRFNPPEGAA